MKAEPLSPEELDALDDTLKRAMEHGQLDIVRYNDKDGYRAFSPDFMQIATGNEDDERDFIEITLPEYGLNFMMGEKSE